MTEALRQSAPANVLDSEEMQCLEEAAIVLSFPPTTRQAGANTASVCAQSFSSIFVDIGPGPVIRSESYEIMPDSAGESQKRHRSKLRPHSLLHFE